VFTVVVVLKAIMEIAGLALLGQGVLYVLAGAGRETNLFYRMLRTITSPMTKLTRLITPRSIVADDYIGFAAFFLTAGLWLALTIIKVQMVLSAAGR
jgi:hypothetical protein